MTNKKNKFYASIRIVSAENRRKAKEKIKNGEFVEDHSYSDIIIAVHKLPIQKQYKCVWCGKPATRKNWREIDGITGSMLECVHCSVLNTNYLLKKNE